MTNKELIRSKEHVIDHGEVMTPHHIVAAMLDLVEEETAKIESRFLEPSCGNGNFLIEILRRKLCTVGNRFHKNQSDYELYALLAVSSIYGIDILLDNILECRYRLFQVFDNAHRHFFGGGIEAPYMEVVLYVLRRNIIHGDALTLRTIGSNPQQLIFSEWSLISDDRIRRRDFVFEEVPLARLAPRLVKEYQPVHFLELANIDSDL